VHLTDVHHVLEHASVPDGVRLPDGRVLIYYVNGADNALWVAVLSGDTAQPLGPITMNGVTRPNGLVDPDALIAEGRVRLFCLAGFGTGSPAAPRAMCAAESTDGLNFTSLGPALVMSSGQMWTDPSVVALADGRWLMAVSEGGNTVLARSADGLSFTAGDRLTYGGVPELSVVDDNRLAVSFINSVYYGFGSCIVTPKTGIALQNRGACFVTDPKHPNCIAPGKRPLHTIIPCMVKKDGHIDMSYGVMGGDYQPMGHMTVAVNRYVYGMDPQEAIDWARYFPRQGKVLAESGVPERVCAGLAARGHALERPAEPLGGGQAIAIDRVNGMLVGGSDPRKDGFALGF
jgi:hypothetical protein